jgi:hypothetical protein
MRIVRLTPAFEECLFHHGLALFNAGAFFECHETWETCWRGLELGPKRLFYQALIQCAVALAHLKRGNRRGGLTLRRRAQAKLAALPPVFMGIDLVRFAADMDSALAEPPGPPPRIALRDDPFVTGEAARLDTPVAVPAWLRTRRQSSQTPRKT